MASRYAQFARISSFFSAGFGCIIVACGLRSKPMKTKLAIVVLLISGSSLLAQETATSGWTDKNNAEMYAAYMMRVAYYELGYMGTRVNVEQQGAKKVFVVDRGPVYHLKAIAISGLLESDISTVIQDAPKPGEVYSQALVNEWVAAAEKWYAAERGGQKQPLMGVHIDHAHAQVTVTLAFD
jgi:outer membrane protein assembly factor BamA